MVQRPVDGGMSGCAGCRLGVAAGVGRGGRCPMVEGHRRAGASLYVAGEPAEKICMVRQGAVSLSREAGDGRGEGMTWTVRRPGSLLGVEALVRGTYLDSARAVTDIKVCVADRDDVEGWMRSRESATRAILECVLLAQCSDVPRRASSDGNACQRVATWILESRDQQPGLPRKVVAPLLGMLPETLSRALGTLADRGLIRVTRRQVEVLDEAALEATAAE